MLPGARFTGMDGDADRRIRRFPTDGMTHRAGRAGAA